MRRLSSALGAAALAGAVLCAPATTTAAGPATTVLRLDGIGPLHLGMTRTAALGTGWLAGRSCGVPSGRHAPDHLPLHRPEGPEGDQGLGRVRERPSDHMSFTRGVRTSTGVTVGRTTTARMVARYRAAGLPPRPGSTAPSRGPSCACAGTDATWSVASKGPRRLDRDIPAIAVWERAMGTGPVIAVEYLEPMVDAEALPDEFRRRTFGARC